MAVNPPEKDDPSPGATAEQVAWAFDHDRRQAWTAAEFFDVEDIHAWMRSGIDDPRDAWTWRNYKWAPADAGPWHHAGSTPVKAAVWIERGWTARQAGLFHQGDFTIQIREDEGRNHVNEWLAFADYDRDCAAEWASFGFALPVAAAVLLSGSDLGERRDQWAAAGFAEVSYRKAWSMVISDPVDAQAWASAPWIPDDPEASARFASHWLSEGFSAPEAHAWKRNMVLLKRAVECREQDITPEQERQNEEARLRRM